MKGKPEETFNNYYKFVLCKNLQQFYLKKLNNNLKIILPYTSCLLFQNGYSYSCDTYKKSFPNVIKFLASIMSQGLTSPLF